MKKEGQREKTVEYLPKNMSFTEDQKKKSISFREKRSEEKHGTVIES